MVCDRVTTRCDKIYMRLKTYRSRWSLHVTHRAKKTHKVFSNWNETKMKQTLKQDESAPVRSPHVESVMKKQQVLRDEWEKEICQSNLTRDGCPRIPIQRCILLVPTFRYKTLQGWKLQVFEELFSSVFSFSGFKVFLGLY